MRQLVAIFSALALAASAAGWHTDILGEPYKARYVEHAPDYSGSVRSTIVRLPSADTSSRRAVLYVHGFNDYFFQDSMARALADAGYNFYAVDLRKYGRSLLPGQTPFEVRDISEYYADIDSALAQMRADGMRHIALMGHSTGGLITSSYMADRRQADNVEAMVLNSPFLDWNESRLNEGLMIPAVRSIAPLFPRLSIPQGGSTGYARSLLKGYGGSGEWEYDTMWKFPVSPPVQASWIAAIDKAHDLVQRDPRIMLPILVMHSDSTVQKGDGEDAYNHKDAVLDVRDIDRYGRTLGPDVTIATVRGGLHDLVLSSPRVRHATLTQIITFLKTRSPE